MPSVDPIEPTHPTTEAIEHTPEELSAHRAAFEQYLPEIQAVPKDTFVKINVEIPGAAMVVLGHLDHVAPYREQILALVPTYRVSSFDKLGGYARAATYAHQRFLAASVPQEPIGPLVEELTKTRDTLLPDVTALTRRGHLDGERLKNLQGTTGFKNIANDVSVLAIMLRDHWPTVQNKTGIVFDEVERAAASAARLLEALARRDAGLAAISEATAVRQAAYTLFFEAYNDVRRAITFLRWNEEDVEAIAPSLFSGRGGRKKADDTVDEAEGNGANGNGANGSAPVVTTPVALPPALGSNGTSNGSTETIPGMPGHSPLGR